MTDSASQPSSRHGVPLPSTISPAARADLEARDRLPPAPPYDTAVPGVWEKARAQLDPILAQKFRPLRERFNGVVRPMKAAGVTLYEITPAKLDLPDCAVLDFHGGAYLFGGGEVAADMAVLQAEANGCVTYALDYRMPPEHPFPAALDDAVAAYAWLIERYDPAKVGLSGLSAGGGLAAALALRLRDEGRPMPGALALLTPEADLTEAGDSMRACVYPTSFRQISDLYAAGRDLADPYLSPLFGNFSGGFPPTLICSGTRDFFLSNSVLLHRRLRNAGVAAELHVWEAMPHGGFSGLTPEDDEMRAEIGRFLRERLG